MFDSIAGGQPGVFIKVNMRWNEFHELELISSKMSAIKILELISTNILVLKILELLSSKMLVLKIDLFIIISGDLFNNFRWP